MTEAEKHFLIQLNEFIPDFSLSDRQMEQLRLFYNNVIAWNEVMNLTTITEEDDVYTKHFLDSYSFLLGVPRETFTRAEIVNQTNKADTSENSANAQYRGNPVSMIDIGTGAGFPGLPIAIAFPDLKVTLLDSLNKRIRFLEDTVQKLELNNVVCVHGRAEDLGRKPDYREQFDIAVSRAVANLSTLCEYCLPFVRNGGYFVAYKSEKASEEMDSGNRAAGILGGNLSKEFSFYLPETDYRRTIISYKKVKETPSKYPRKAGTPAKDPLGK